MRQSLMQMITCRWSARRIQRYLDADPVAHLTPGEVAKIEAHLAICEKCTQAAAEHRVLHTALAKLWGEDGLDQESTGRLRAFLADIVEEPR